MRRRDLRGTDMSDHVHDGADPPLDVSSTPIIFTLPAETGLSYEFCVFMPHRDPRGDPPVHAAIPFDPLGIECCSHHTVLTDHKERALLLLVEVLGGRIVHEGRNDLLATQSTFVALANGVIELGQPLEEGSPAMQDWQSHAPDERTTRSPGRSGTWIRRPPTSRHRASGFKRGPTRRSSPIPRPPTTPPGVAWGLLRAVSGDHDAERPPVPDRW